MGQIKIYPQVLVGNEPFKDPTSRTSDGLIAIGGDLSVGRLLQAYSSGIFPWFNDDQGPILWWSPDPREVIYPTDFHVSRSFRKWCRKNELLVTVDKRFDRVIAECARPRSKRETTWITSDMRRAYVNLHREGYAHSLEVWRNSYLVGGLYGVSLGLHFYAESMFSNVANGSKIALFSLCQLLSSWNFHLVDCQLPTPHLQSLGATEMTCSSFLELVRNNRSFETKTGPWTVTPFRPRM